MNSSESVVQQRQKEGRALKIFLISSLIGSLALHAAAMTFKVGNFWSVIPEVPENDEMELVVEETPPEEPIPEEVLAEVEPPPEEIPEEVTFAPELAPPPPLAPENQAPVEKGEDAPSDKPLPASPDSAQPMTNNAGDTNLKVGGGPIFKPFGLGTGFGTGDRPTGFNPLCKPDGDPKGKLGGTAIRTAPPAKPAKPKDPVCVSCPKPRYQGREASPRVDMKILPDGSVQVRLRKSSGNPDLDRETLETMSKWRFDPQTVPSEGVRKRVRVTYEEEGSSFQRQNEERRRREAERRQEAERRRLAEEERRQAEERQRAPATAVETPETIKPAASPATPVPAASEPPAVIEQLAPVAEPAPPPAPEPPAPEPPVAEPAPVAPPPPAPVEAAPAPSGN
ncbi:energy transducer TonB family protein [Leptothermofonsia sp. ETS-13]|uniref:energy transducer TonB family protein n=1 Tax=Leptothermofonsia sp. ETS-13 TaxID=3035696 RepID=UPI003BA031EC